MKNVRESQEAIFRDLYAKHAGAPMAVSSESLAHKELRYEMLSGLFDGDDDFTVHDVGCGMADFLSFLKRRLPGKRIRYSGTEILEEFRREAAGRHPESEFFLRDLAEGPGGDRHDYVVLSGVFHQRRDTRIPEWERFAQALLRNSFAMAGKGIGFNFISPFVDFYQEQVYYCNIYKLITFIHDELSRFFEIRHHYALFEFTVFVYQPSFIRARHPQPEFAKYFPPRP